MPGNPNMQKMGKRKAPSGQKQPDWLFPATGQPGQSPKSHSGDKLKNKQDKELAKDLLKRRAAGEPPKSSAPAQLVELIGAFLVENEFTTTSQSFRTERKSRDEHKESIDGLPSLSKIYNEWRELKGEKNILGMNTSINGDTSGVKMKRDSKSEKVEKPKLKVKDDVSDISGSENSSSSIDESNDSGDSDIEMKDAPPTKKVAAKKASSSSSSSASSSSDSDADDEDEAPIVKVASPKPKVNARKRKASPSSDSSTSGSDSSSEDETPKAKKIKIKAAQSSSSSSSSSSESGSSSEGGKELSKDGKATSTSTGSTSSSSDSDSSSSDEEPEVLKLKTGSSSSDSGSSSSSESDENSDSSITSIAQKIPLPASDSESSSESDSDSESDTPPKKITTKQISSDTSATLSDAPKKMTPDSSSSESESEPKVMEVTTTVAKTSSRKISPPLPPNPVVKSKRTNVPFSRIPKDIKVDERLASNKYVPYDYAQKAHEDLIVTKGKGFTKEKNKKKRGSYKGGYIDVEGKKGIKFED